MSLRALQRNLAWLDCWLAEHRPRYHRGLRAGASAVKLQALAEALQRPLPPSLRILLAWHDGQAEDCRSHFEQDWDLMSTEEIAAAKNNRDAESPPGWGRDCIPILADDRSDYLCLDASQKQPPLLAFWSGREKPEAVAPSLPSWFKLLVNRVERGQYQEDSERGTFLWVPADR